MPIIGPTQPMAGGGAVQENFRQMVDHVQTYNPDATPQLIKRRLNTRLREVQDYRLWAGLLVRGIIQIPASYSTGSVDVTTGSDIVTGTATTWPFNDLVNTTLSADITVINEIQDITPGSMTNINAGDFLVLDTGASLEYLLVISTSTTTFKAKPTMTHTAGVAITKSSLQRRQFRLGVTKPFYTIQGVIDASTLKLDLPWSDSSSTGSAYQIVLAYVSFEQNYRSVLTLVNTEQGWRLRTNMPQEVANVYDAWRQTTGWTYMLLDYMPDEIGRMQYELYPTPSMQQAFPYLGYRTIPNLEDDEDTPPPAIPSHLLVHGAIADVMLFNRKSAYYDPSVANTFSQRFTEDLMAAVMADDNIYMQNLQWAYSKYPFTQHGAAYWQSHDVDSVRGYV